MLEFYSCSTTHSELLSSMDEMKSLLNGLRRKHSTLSLHSVASSFAPSVKTKEAMKQLCKHLYRAGVTADMIRKREAHAVAVFKYPNVPPVVSQQIPQTLDPVVHGDELLEEREPKEKSRIIRLGINSTPARGSALHMAAAIGSRQRVELLLANGANIEALRSDHGGTPLDSAAYNGHTDVVRLLLEKGANIEAMRSDNGGTPLNSAAYNGHLDVVRLLLEKGANIDATKSDGSTALETACGEGKWEW